MIAAVYARTSKAAIVTALLLTVGCTTPVVLRHPDGRRVECGPYDARPLAAAGSAMRESQCINDYQRQGSSGCPSKKAR